MSSSPRITSEFLHIIVRGIGKQIIFEDNRDCISYLAILSYPLSSLKKFQKLIKFFSA